VFDRVERSVGGTLEELVRAQRFADAVSVVTKLQVRGRKRVENLTSRVLHLWNIPAASDVRRVDDHLARVERSLRDVAKRVDEMGGDQ
jgi:hypothetical protein